MCRASLWPLLLSCRAMNLLDHIASKINITFYSWVDWLLYRLLLYCVAMLAGGRARF